MWPPAPGCVRGRPGRWRGAALPALGLRWAVAAMFVVLDLPCEEEDTSFEPPSQKGKSQIPSSRAHREERGDDVSHFFFFLNQLVEPPPALPRKARAPRVSPS